MFRQSFKFAQHNFKKLKFKYLTSLVATSAFFSFVNLYIQKKNKQIFNQEIDDSAQQSEPTILDNFFNFKIEDIYVKKILSFDEVKNLLQHHRFQSNTIVFFSKCPPNIREKLIQLVSVKSGSHIKSRYKLLEFDSEEYLKQNLNSENSQQNASNTVPTSNTISTNPSQQQQLASSNTNTIHQQQPQQKPLNENTQQPQLLQQQSSSPQKLSDKDENSQNQLQQQQLSTPPPQQQLPFILQPQNQPSALSSLNSEEQQKQKDLEQFERVRNADVLIVNRCGDLQILNFADRPENFQRASVFLDPPEILFQKDTEWLLQKIERLPQRERCVITFIPEKHVYEGVFTAQLQLKTEDLYRQRKLKNIKQIEEDYRQLRYGHLTPSTRFYVIRDESLANTLGIYRDDIGEVYHLKRGGLLHQNGEVNWRFRGQQIIFSRLDTDPNIDSGSDFYDSVSGEALPMTVKQKQLKLQEKDMDYVNIVECEADLHFLLRVAEDMGVKKLLLVSGGNGQEDSVRRAVIKLARTKRGFRDREFLAVYTRSKNLMMKYFGILPDEQREFTVRYIDFTNSVQKEIDSLKQQQHFPQDLLTNYKIFNFTESLKNNNDISLNQNLNKQNNQKNAIPFDLDNQQEVQNFWKNSCSQAQRFKYQGRKLTVNKLQEFVKNCNISTINPSDTSKQNQFFHLEQEHSTTNYYSSILNSRLFKKEAMDSDDNCIIFFFKPDCQACRQVSKGFEQFTENVLNIQQLMLSYQQGKTKYLPYEDNVINRYRIRYTQSFQGLKVYRYNIYNECPEFPSPSATPLVFLLKKGEKLQPIHFDLVKDKVRIDDPDKVARYLLRKVEDVLK